MSWYRLILGMLIFEVCLYQTRYLLNGIREDPTAAPMLPSNRRNDDLQRAFTPLQVVTGTLFSIVRAVAFYLLVTRLNLLSHQQAMVVMLSFGVAFLMYEAPREAFRLRYQEIWASAKPTKDSSPRWTSQGLVERGNGIGKLCSKGAGWGLYLLVVAGGGYALRAAVALMLVSNVATTYLSAEAWTAVAWMFGCAMVGAGWARESMGAVFAPPVEPVGAIETSSAVVHPGIATKPQLTWAAEKLGLIESSGLHFGLVGPSETLETSNIPLSQFEGNRRSSWRVAGVVALVLAGVACGGGTALAVIAAAASLVLLIDFPKDWGRQIFRPPVVPLALAVAPWLVFVGSGLTWTSALASGLVWVWILYSMDASERGSLHALITARENLDEWVKEAVERVTHALAVVFNLVLGGTFVRSLSKVFGRS